MTEKELDLNKCPLDVFFEEDKFRQATDYWGNTGTIIGWSKPIVLSCPRPGMETTGGWWWFRRDKDNAVVGVHPKMINFNNKK